MAKCVDIATEVGSSDMVGEFLHPSTRSKAAGPVTGTSSPVSVKKRSNNLPAGKKQATLTAMFAKAKVKKKNEESEVVEVKQEEEEEEGNVQVEKKARLHEHDPSP
ncbi:hypothetical protein L9F63_024024, partial [Diploptera punctata]